jgi:phospholipid-binding lipoprotein MlaA
MRPQFLPRLVLPQLALPRLAALLLVLGLGACAGTGPNPGTTAAAPTDPTDPFEATNREILDFNFRLDDALLKPVAVFYRNSLGSWTRTRIRNLLENLNEPGIAANALLQGRPLESAQTTLRFLINSVGGIGGMFDLVSIGGPPRVDRDLGQTLAVWGVGDGPYLMLPFAGPSNPRELTGSIGNGFLNPISWVLPIGANLGRSAVLGVDQREQNIETIEEIRTNSLDVYARLRSLWQQNRDAQLGRASAEPAALDDPEATPRR